MHKSTGIKKIIAGIFAMLVIGGLGGIVMDRFLLPFLSTVRGLRNIPWLNPQSPILITRREEIRINEGINTIEIASRTKNSLAAVFIHESEFGAPRFRLISQPTGAVVSHDGIIAAPLPEMKPGYLVTVLVQEQFFRATVLIHDSFSGLSFLKIEASNLPVIKQAPHLDIRPGEKLLLMNLNGSPDLPLLKSVTAAGQAVARANTDHIFELKVPNAFLLTDSENDEALLGAAVVNKDGDLAGLLTKVGQQNLILRLEDLKLAIDNFLDDGKILWPEIDVSYKILSKEMAQLHGLPKKYGILIVDGASVLLPNDFVFEVSGQALSFEDDFQEAVLRQKPGSKIRLKLMRKGQEMEADLQV